MSDFGKFTVEFTPGDWSFVWTVSQYNYTAASSAGSTTLSCSFSTGDSATDMLGFLDTLAGRMSTAIDAAVVDPQSTFADADLWPTDFVFNWVDGPVGSEASTTQTFQHSTAAIGIGGWVNTILSDSAWAVHLQRIDWSSCSDGILTALGFDESETVQSNHTIIPTYVPRYCWFPGLETYGSSSGGGVTSDTGWRPVDAHSRVVSGGGNMRTTGPARLQYTRVLRFEALKRAEVLEARHRGPLAFFDQWATKTYRWYPDRDIGTTTTAGTRGDPGPPSYHVDSDVSYWKCKLASAPRITQAGHHDWFAVTITLNGEPA